MESLAKNFSQYFQVGLALTRQQQRFAYAIRYQVYAEELGWEPLNEHRLETDSCDDYAYHCLLEHKRSGDVAGCVRLVLPQISRPEAPLPCQTHPIPLRRDRHLNEFTGEPVGEISRLAVPSNFRRRAKEKGKPFILDSHSSATIYSEEERRNFPNISIGLYLAAIALVELCDLDRVLVVMEPRLQRHLQRFGLVFHQISQTFELRGQRALFELPRDELTINMGEQILELYHLIQNNLERQFDEMQQLHYETTHSNDVI
ncbi:MAG: PEP-CTERM/exosortase system-associated acyltransferase [Candidatus Thiodiazotropha sp.]|jgi:N-acyl amino acid synthase of PEP-CTERM/exosortase system